MTDRTADTKVEALASLISPLEEVPEEKFRRVVTMLESMRHKPEIKAALDGMRAIAFMMVFLQHYCGLKWGWSGVDLFFVLSGFLITGILFDSRNDLHRARNFYVRRTLRIFPLYYGIMLLLLLSSPVFHWDWSWGYLV